MMEQDRIVCPQCEKIIRYERPLFCPHCGAKLDPTDGLDVEGNHVELYRWSGIAPTLMRLLLGWLTLFIGGAFISLFISFPSWARKGFILLSFVFALSVIVLFLLSLFVARKK